MLLNWGRKSQNFVLVGMNELIGLPKRTYLGRTYEDLSATCCSMLKVKQKVPSFPQASIIKFHKHFH